MSRPMSVIPRLEHLAFSVSYKDIVCNLILCHDHCPEDKQLKSVKYSTLITAMRSYLTSHNMISYVRNRLNHFLVGAENDKIRANYVKKFYENQLEFKKNLNVDVWVFLDCVLDSTFQELETHISFPKSEPNPKLITTIASRSPHLKKLKIDFKLMKKELPVEKLIPVVTSLNSLHHLTSLSLFNLEEESHSPILKFLGKSCPLLSHLSICGFLITKKDVLSIMLGELVDHLFVDNIEKPWKEDAVLQSFQVPAELLTPFCSTLRHLELENVHWDEFSARYYSPVVFMLRNLPLLEKLNGKNTSMAIKILQNTRSEVHTEFEKILREASSRSIAPVQLNIEHNRLIRPFSGTLFLTTLDCVCLMYADMLRVIGSVCPALKDVVFWEESPDWRLKERASPEEIEPILNGWPKLETITIFNVSPKFVKVILNAFAGPKLKKLTLNCCEDINLEALLPCSQLESLRLGDSSSLIPPEDQHPLDHSSFLPNLKTFEAAICLKDGVWASLFELKPSLTRIALNCCHIGTNVSTHSDWSNIHQMWPMVESLTILQCTGLVLSLIPYTFSQLAHLKKISLPDKVKFKEEDRDKLLSKVLNDLASRPAPITLHFNGGYYGKIGSRTREKSEICPFLDDGENERNQGDLNENPGGDESDQWTSDELEEEEGDFDEEEEEDEGDFDDGEEEVDDDDEDDFSEEMDQDETGEEEEIADIE